MNNAGIAVLIIFLVILFLLFCLWVRCCYLERRFVSPLEKLPLVYGRPKVVDLMIKKCDQDSTNEVEENIIFRLKRNMQHRGMQLVERTWDQALDSGQKPVLLFCVVSSRIGTDIENAMRGIHGESRVILVVLHYKLRTLLTGQLSDDEDLLDSTLKNRMTGIAHFAFSNEGLYDCRQNTIGFQKLLEIVS